MGPTQVLKDWICKQITVEEGICYLVYGKTVVWQRGGVQGHVDSLVARPLQLVLISTLPLTLIKTGPFFWTVITK